jgi:hypothetical protein
MVSLHTSLARIKKAVLTQQLRRPSYSLTLPLLSLCCFFWCFSPHSRQREFLQAHVAKNIVVAATCGTIFWMQGRESEALPTFSNSSFNVSSLWYFAMLYTILSNLQIIPQLFFFRVRYAAPACTQS